MVTLSCSSCGRRLDDEYAYCIFCGTKVMEGWTCVSCHRTIPFRDFRYCVFCGAKQSLQEVPWDEDIEREIVREITRRIRLGELKMNRSSTKFRGDCKRVFGSTRKIVSERLLLVSCELDDKTEMYHAFYVGRTTNPKSDVGLQIDVNGGESENLLVVASFSEPHIVQVDLWDKVEEGIKEIVKTHDTRPTVVTQECPNCGAKLDLTKATPKGVVKCDNCRFLVRLPRSIGEILD